ncbi:MAG: CoA-binding protein [Stellaceae bacterium]
MNHDDDYPDAYLRDILTSARTIAVVGASPRPNRPSHRVMRFLQRCGYRCLPVNPFAVGSDILGERVYARLADIPRDVVGPVDMIDIFRRSELAGVAVEEAIAIGAQSVWMQLDVRDNAAAARAEAHGIKVVMNRCPAIEIPRLGIGPR